MNNDELYEIEKERRHRIYSLNIREENIDKVLELEKNPTVRNYMKLKGECSVTYILKAAMQSKLKKMQENGEIHNTNGIYYYYDVFGLRAMLIDIESEKQISLDPIDFEEFKKNTQFFI